MISLDPVVDGLFLCIISTSFDRSSVADSLLDHLVRNHDGDDRCYGLIAGSKHLVQHFSLCDSTRETVKKETVHALDSLESIVYHAFHYFIRNQ